MADAVTIFGFFEKTYNAILKWLSVPVLGETSILEVIIAGMTLAIILRFLIMPLFGKFSISFGSFGGSSSSAERPQNRYGRAVDSRNRKVSVRWDTDFTDSV